MKLLEEPRGPEVANDFFCGVFFGFGDAFTACDREVNQLSVYQESPLPWVMWSSRGAIVKLRTPMVPLDQAGERLTIALCV